MISGKDIYQVVSALVPLYVAMILAYGSVRWWKVFTPDQCAGINRFVAVFATPFLVFDFICSNNPYKMNLRFIAADSLQKVAVLVVLFIWQATTRRGELDWTITLFSLSTLPNTLVMGVPLLKSMYGEFSSPLMIQVCFMQSVLWYTLLLSMFEYRGAKRLVAGQFPETAASISSFKVDSAVVSLGGHEPLETDAEIDDDGKLRVVVRRSSATSSNFSSRDRFDGWNPDLSVHLPPRASNFSSVEVFSVQSSPRASSYRQTDLSNLTNSFGDIYSLQSSRNSVPRISSNLEEEMGRKNGVAFPGSPSCVVPQKQGGGAPAPNKDLHMVVWSSSISSNISDHRYLKADQINGSHTFPDPFNGAAPQQDNIAAAASTAKKQQMPPATVLARLIAMMVGRKLVRNPNTYASLLGLLWSLISFRWSIKLPLIVDGSVKILSNAGLGMAMFSLGLFAALQPKVIASGKVLALISMAIKFLTGPAVMAAASLAFGLRGDLLRVAIVQAALPSGILPFIFAKEYNLHANIQSTSVIFGMVVALPVTIIYYVLLDF
ncbi:PREDICTED: auxin efflux carrier component 2-like [Populus euphratica]|uniref:Auxin efflux carrier component n=1 Tax=Populus euphratica TaxID=75702 RepID=A0AAJ6T003_POPEU|nr:PREDICTED: auxin efflux carrier component 2-like [Populus euphratica]